MGNDSNTDDLVRDFLQKIVDHLPIALFCKDARHNFQYVFWNATAVQMWGFSTVEVVGRDDFELFPHERAQAFREKDQETMDGREVVYIEQEEVPTTKGNRLSRTWKIPIFGDDGGPQWLLGISQDISHAHRFQDDPPSAVAILTKEALKALDQGNVAGARAVLESILKLKT